MSKARDLANAGTALTTVSATELGYVDGVTSAIQTQLDAKTAKSTLTTTGDIYYASSASTPARLGVGSTGNVLTVAGGVPTWAAPAGGAGNMVQVATGTLSGTSVTLSSLSSYTDLILRMSGITTGGSYQLKLLINNNTGSNYNNLTVTNTNTTTDWERDLEGLDTSITVPYGYYQYNNGNNNWNFKFTNCKNPGFTDYLIHPTHIRADAQDRYLVTGAGVYIQSEAVSSLVITTTSGATFAGGNYTLWGA